MNRLEKGMACSALHTDLKVRGKIDPSQVVAQQKATASSIGCEKLGFDVDEWKTDRELRKEWEKRCEEVK